MRSVGTFLLWAFLFVMAASPPGGPAAAEKVAPEALTPASLYQAETFVTGKREVTRIPGIKEAFRTVLVKVSGAASLLNRADLWSFTAQAQDAVSHYEYRDLMAGLPLHDEQGSRDRPYALTVHFDPRKIDAVLAQLGVRTWPLPRPTITPFVTVDFQGKHFFILRQSFRGRSQRESLLAEANKRGLPLALPDAAQVSGLSAERATLDDLVRRATAQNSAHSPSQGSTQGAGQESTQGAGQKSPRDAAGPKDTALLVGSLIWNEDQYLWTSHWRFHGKNDVHNWTSTSKTFDGAFRSGLDGAAEILSQTP